MRFFVGLGAGLLLLAGSCRPDQVEHLSNTKELAVEAENHQVKRILPAVLLQAARWAGDSLTQTADRALQREMTARLAAGGVAAALPYCRPETYPAIDSLARVLRATPRRVSTRPRNPAHAARTLLGQQHPDTTRLVRRAAPEVFGYERPIVLADAQCLRCHGVVGQDIAPAEYALIKQRYPQDQATGYQLGQAIGVWQVALERVGVAEFYTMKTRKIFKRRF